MPRKPSVPSYRYHKARNCAVVTINGRNHYLGEWQSEASKKKYDALIKQWLANGRAVAEPTPPDHKQIITVCEVVEAFWIHAEKRYQKAGSWRVVLRTLIDMYGDQSAAEFGPVKLRAVMQALVERGNCRQYVNKNMHRVRKIFKWAAAHELIDVVVHQRLEVVEALQKGTTDAPEGRKVLPVSDAVVNATVAELGPLVADMVKLQRLIGCRPGELIVMRPRDIDRTDEIWLYVPESHKTEHLGKSREIFIGPRAQLILQAYLLRGADECCFSIKRQNYAQAVARAAKRAGQQMGLMLNQG
jgi:integrase